MKEREALKLAIEALKTAQNNLAPSKGSAHAYGDGELWDKYADAIKACEEALAQPEQRSVSEHLEPVAWIEHHKAGDNLVWDEPNKGTPLYTTPPQRKPLTDAQLEKGRGQTFSTNNPFCPCDSKTFRKVARWVEAAHDIKE